MIPDSFDFEIAENLSSMELTSGNAEIKIWASPRDKEMWNQDEDQGKKKLASIGFLVDQCIFSDSLILISANVTKEGVPHYFYMKALPFSESVDLIIAYKTPSVNKDEAIIRNVLELFPKKPF